MAKIRTDRERAALETPLASPSSEIDDATSVLAVAMRFFWDCHVFPEDGPVFVTSHDEWNAFVTFRDQDRTIPSAFAHWVQPEML
jgi:hypothetical protein